MSFKNFCNTSFKQLVSGFLVVLWNNFAIHHSTTSRESVGDVREVLKHHKPVIITNTPHKPCYFFIHTARNILHWPCTFKNTIILPVSPPKFCIEMCFHFLQGLTMVPRENGDNAYAGFWRTDKGVLWYFWKWPIGKCYLFSRVHQICPKYYRSHFTIFLACSVILGWEYGNYPRSVLRKIY